MRRFRHLLLALSLTLSIIASANFAHAQKQVVLGNSTVALNGPWKFHIGDNMAWASPNFDDSGWGTMDLTPPPGSVDPITGIGGFVSGWTAHGYPGYSGYAWYRLRVNIQDKQSALALKMPDAFEDAYQVYVNGQLVGEFGRFTKHGATHYVHQPRAFSMPTRVLHGNESGPVTIAIRMWMAAATPLREAGVGGLQGPPVLGQASAIHALMRTYRDAIDRAQASTFFVMEIELLALLVAFGLFWLDRSEPAYLWLGLVCAVVLIFQSLIVLQFRTIWAAGIFAGLLFYAVLLPASLGLWVLFWGYWFRVDGMARLQRMVWGLAVLLGVSAAMRLAPVSGHVVPVHANVWLTPLAMVLQMLLGVLLVWVTVRGIRKDRTEGWLALPAVLLLIISVYPTAYLGIPVWFVLFGLGVSLPEVSIFVSLAIILVLLLRRFLHGQRQREQWKAEIEQARQVQQLLIPEAVPAIPGFTVESEYHPAQHVGGDFFQVLPGKDGSILTVVGDVSGKGLKAAMLVSLIVGTIRTLAKFTRDPMEMLQGLNERLSGRMQGHFATCVVLHIAAHGETTIANAGHLAPYLNGEEVTIAGSLPLGIADAAEFEHVRFTLQPGDRLTLMTDGVVEATNEKRELFGFERTQQISNRPAAAIADKAKAFGQQDDITVVTVTRTANLEVALA